MKIHVYKLLLLATFFTFNCFSQSYELTDLGSQIGSNSYAQGINNQGQVVGYWYSTNGAHAFVYQNGMATDLGLLGATNNYALSINDQGQIVGYSETTNGARAFLYQDGGMTNLGSLDYAFGINAGAQIVGSIDTTNGSLAILYNGGSSTIIGTLGGTNSFGFGINNSGQVVGTSLEADNLTTHPFLWQDGTMVDLNQILFFTGNWQLIDARGINDAGDIVGLGEFNDLNHAYLFTGGGVAIDLGALPGGTNSYALGLNNSHQIVGASSSATGDHAVIWQDEALHDLNDLVSAYGWQLKEACGINDFGQIVGWGMLNGQAHAFLLTPRTTPTLPPTFLRGSGFQPMSLGSGFTVTITYPDDNTKMSSPTDLQINASTADDGGTVTQVQFYAGSKLLGRLPSSPWSIIWSNAPIGRHVLMAIASDDAGQFATSSIVNVSITTNLLPVADSYVRGGTYATINYGTSSLLLGWTASDINNYCDSYFKFNLAGVTNISSAHLKVYSSATPLAAVVNTAYAVSSTNWTESGITWNNRPGLGSALSAIYVGVAGWYDYSIGEYVQSKEDAGERFISIALHQPVTSTSYIATNSKENGSSKPYLLIETTVLPLSVSLTSPNNNATFLAPTDITLNANASEGDGDIVQVQFLAGTRLLGVATNVPYNIVWSNASIGSYALTAVAVDGLGLTATSSVVNIVISTNLSPLADTYVRDGAYTNTNFGTNIVMESLTTTTNGNNRDIYFKFDLSGLNGTISSAKLNVFGGSSAGGATTNTIYSATDTNWLETNITWSSKPARVTPLSTNVVAATNWYTFDVTAFAKSQKSAGQNIISLVMHDLTNSSQLITINSKENSANRPVLVITTTNGPPSVSIIGPTNNTVMVAPADVAITATASDYDTVSQVQIFQGNSSFGILTDSPYGLVWSNVSAGTYALTARATDNSGLVTTSSVVTMIVDAPPVVTLTNPANNSLFLVGTDIALAASATDVDGTIKQVELFQGTTSLGIDTNAPYSFIWTNVISGTYALTAQATDNYGAVSTSSVVTINVDFPPQITSQPLSATMFVGADAGLLATVQGLGSINYQWHFQGTNIPGATNEILAINSVQLNNAGVYSVTISNILGSIDSSNATLTVLPYDPTSDSDYDGRNNDQELADGTDPLNAGSVASVFLTSLAFDDTNTWAGGNGQWPLVASNVVGISSWSSNAVCIDTNLPALLKYRDVETNGNANINLHNGTVRFWFRPDWVSGTGPGSSGRLIEMGSQTPTNGWWSLYLNTNGTQLTFGTQTNGTAVTNLTAAISWTNNFWHQIVLTYSPTNSSLYLDGQLVVTNGTGVSGYPSLAERTNGLCIGSDLSGNRQARGAFDALDAFNYPLDATVIADNYQAMLLQDNNGDGMSDGWEVLHFGTINVDPNGDPDGDYLNNLQEYQYGTDPNNADTDGDGRTDWQEIIDGTNPNNADTDSDGLTDSQEINDGTNPNNPDTDGDGRTDWQEIMDGTDPLNAGSKATSLFMADANPNTQPYTISTVPALTKWISNGVTYVALTNGMTNIFYDLFGTTNLGVSWTWLGKLNIQGQYTNATSAYQQLNWQIGSMPDGDGDGLTDVYEQLVTHTGTNNPDSDYDGRNDGQELADGTDPLNAGSVASVFLTSLAFDDTNTWAGGNGQWPLVASNVVGISSWSSNAVCIDTNLPALLKYRDVETNGNANINLHNGTVRFWFRPDWVSGTGPGSSGRLIEMGSQTPTNGWWSLYLNTNGTQLTFGTQTNGTAVTNLTAAISWTNNFWHQIVLTYSPTNSSLYLDGQLVVTNGTGVSGYPSLAERTNGLCIGSDLSGNRQARGAFDALDAFNYPLDATVIADNYQAMLMLQDNNGDGMSDGWEVLHFGTINVDPNGDPDGDYLNNLQEYQYGTDPNNADTDGDGRTDWQEIIDGTNPVDLTRHATWPMAAYQPFGPPTQPGGQQAQVQTAPNLAATVYNGINSYYVINGAVGGRYKVLGSPSISGPWNWVGIAQPVDMSGRTIYYKLIVSGMDTYYYKLGDAYDDTDGDGLADAMEGAFGGNPQTPDPGWKLDGDNDGLPDTYETLVGLNKSVVEAAPVLPAYNKCPLP